MAGEKNMEKIIFGCLKRKKQSKQKEFEEKCRMISRCVDRNKLKDNGTNIDEVVETLKKNNI